MDKNLGSMYGISDPLANDFVLLTRMVFSDLIFATLRAKRVICNGPFQPQISQMDRFYTKHRS